jgi:hypothetical protein
MAPISFRFSGHLNITDQADTKTKLGDRASTASDDVASSVGPGVTDVGFVYQASIRGGLELKPPCGGCFPTLLRGQGWVAKPENGLRSTHGIQHRPLREENLRDQSTRLRKSKSENNSHGKNPKKKSEQTNNPKTRAHRTEHHAARNVPYLDRTLKTY